LQVGNTHATCRAILFKNLNYILREIYDILSEDALNYPVVQLLNCCYIERVDFMSDCYVKLTAYYRQDGTTRDSQLTVTAN